MDEKKEIKLTQYAYIPGRSACLPGIFSVAVICAALYTGHLFGNALQTANEQATLQKRLAGELPVKTVLASDEIKNFLPGDSLPIKRVAAVITDLEEGQFAQAYASIDGKGFPRLPATEELGTQLETLSNHEKSLRSSNSENYGLELKRGAITESVQALRKDMHKLFRDPNYMQSVISDSKQVADENANSSSAPGFDSAQFYHDGILAKLPRLPWLPAGLQQSSELEPFLRNPPGQAGGDQRYWADLEVNLAALQTRAEEIQARIGAMETERASIESRNQTLAAEMSSLQAQIIALGKSILFEIAAPQADEQETTIYLYVQRLLAGRTRVELPRLHTF